MPTYDYHCSTCLEDTIVLAKYEERDSQVCPECSGPLVRQLSAPNFPKASYVDGQKRKGWTDIREASKLSIEAAQSKDATRKEIHKEIRDKLKVSISQDK